MSTSRIERKLRSIQRDFELLARGRKIVAGLYQVPFVVRHLPRRKPDRDSYLSRRAIVDDEEIGSLQWCGECNYRLSDSYAVADAWPSPTFTGPVLEASVPDDEVTKAFARRYIRLYSRRRGLRDFLLASHAAGCAVIEDLENPLPIRRRLPYGTLSAIAVSDATAPDQELELSSGDVKLAYGRVQIFQWISALFDLASSKDAETRLCNLLVINRCVRCGNKILPLQKVQRLEKQHPRPPELDEVSDPPAWGSILSDAVRASIYAIELALDSLDPSYKVPAADGPVEPKFFRHAGERYPLGRKAWYLIKILWDGRHWDHEHCAQLSNVAPQIWPEETEVEDAARSCASRANKLFDNNGLPYHVCFYEKRTFWLERTGHSNRD